MKKYDLLTPEGTRDLIYEECAALRNVGEKLRKIFTGHGYTEVITPGLEFFDVFNNKSRHYPQEVLYKLTDGKGRLMVMRPDSTMPIARIVGTRLRTAPMPLKLFCNQTIYRANPKESGRDDEFFQSGIEIIGGEVMRADMEALSIAAEVMQSFEVDDYRFEIGDSGFFTLLSSKLGMKEQELEDLREYVMSKNYPALDEMLAGYGDNKYAKAIGSMTRLFGGSDVFAAARAVLPEEALPILDRLERVHESLCALGMGGKITVDLGFAAKSDAYYTGIVFNGYISGYGMPVLSGGRYDRLIADFGVDTPATGFAVNENAVAAALLKRSGGMLLPAPDVMIYAEDGCIADAIVHCRKLIADGMTAEYSDLADVNASRELAKTRKCRRFDIVSETGVTSEEIG
ncbi:MAG: ATP phosphoribosyltransferase regulatory subunit [Ruminiclostridium sp.]|nr:ATP phosphoribosyltransferase regulatory subunit [Ruminiclostridium sp.]